MAKSNIYVFSIYQVNFNEPLSMLQRLSEDFEYSRCLDRAAECDTSAEELAHLAAFTISSYSTTTNRSTKPFNPLLGETYECDRTEDYGWRTIAEQVMLIRQDLVLSYIIVRILTNLIYSRSPIL